MNEYGLYIRGTITSPCPETTWTSLERARHALENVAVWFPEWADKKEQLEARPIQVK